MPASQFAVIYSAATGRVRSIHVHNGKNETDATLSKSVLPGPGEALLLLDMAQYAPLDVLQTTISQLTTKIPSGDRYAVVDGLNNVVGAYILDPLCGDIAPLPSASLIASDVAAPGWTYDPKGRTFVAPVAADAAPV